MALGNGQKIKMSLTGLKNPYSFVTGGIKPCLFLLFLPKAGDLSVGNEISSKLYNHDGKQ